MTGLETHYLIVGAGAVGLAFVDTLLDEDPDCHVTIIDKHAKPGGHWNDAYSFVALHQPSAFTVSIRVASATMCRTIMGRTKATSRSPAVPKYPLTLRD